uniref:Sideroflexin 4 n=1 Tax=Pavo cristatus TaxID=9049 RepID=A0A8C9ELR0_PAVCR
MDANLRLWRSEGPSFWQRLLLWADVLDPLHLLKSADEIRKARLLLENSKKTQSEPIQNHQASVHPDTGKIIPVFFRPPAFLPVTLPLVISSSLQLQAKQIFLCQFAFHAYTTGFTLFNGNGTTKDQENSLHQKQILLGVGAVSYAALLGAFPFIFMDRYTLKSPITQLIVKRLLPAPLFGLMSAFTVVAVRSPEFENGIEVMDRNGKVVGVSQKAGEKVGKVWEASLDLPFISCLELNIMVRVNAVCYTTLRNSTSGIESWTGLGLGLWNQVGICLVSPRVGSFPKPIYQAPELNHRTLAQAFLLSTSPQKEERLLKFLLLIGHLREKHFIVNSTCIFQSRNIV